MKYISDQMQPSYDDVYCHYNDEYFYVRDITGNIIQIIDINGNIQVEYKYDAWGKILSL